MPTARPVTIGLRTTSQLRAWEIPAALDSRSLSGATTVAIVGKCFARAAAAMNARFAPSTSTSLYACVTYVTVCSRESSSTKVFLMRRCFLLLVVKADITTWRSKNVYLSV